MPQIVAGEAVAREPLLSLPFPAGNAFHSPSLQRGRHQDGRAREVKAIVTESQAAQIASRLSPMLSVDPHGDPALDYQYNIATVYFDTPARDVFHRRGRFGLTKFRARRYGTAAKVFLERKSRQKNRVRKRRTSLELARFDELLLANECVAPESGWFARQLRRHQLEPVCLIEYRRAAYYGFDSRSAMRLTFDRQIRGGLQSQWSFDRAAPTLPLITDEVVCEFKFRSSMPALFKKVICDLQLLPQGFSKYRHCLQAWGFAAEGAIRHA